MIWEVAAQEMLHLALANNLLTAIGAAPHFRRPNFPQSGRYYPKDFRFTLTPFDAATLQCPFPHYSAMRERAPVFEVAGLGLFLVTRHDLVLEVLRDPATYSNRFGQTSMPLPSAALSRTPA